MSFGLFVIKSIKEYFFQPISLPVVFSKSAAKNVLFVQQPDLLPGRMEQLLFNYI
jgi:hypothetical protein